MLKIFCDGACRGNPGPMGWAAVIVREGEILKEISGGSAETGTNNTAEMRAILVGLEGALSFLSADDKIVHVISDSNLAIGLLSQGWRSKKAHLIRCRQSIRMAEAKLDVIVKYVKGGVEDELFQLADVLAKDAVPKEVETKIS